MATWKKIQYLLHSFYFLLLSHYCALFIIIFDLIISFIDGVCPQPKGIGYDVMLAEKEDEERRRRGQQDRSGNLGGGGNFNAGGRMSLGTTFAKIMAV